MRKRPTPDIISALTRVQPQYNLGNVLAKQGRWSEAIAAYRDALKVASHYKIHLKLAQALEQQGEVEAAIKSYRKVVEIQPELKEVYKTLGDLLHRQGRLEEAKACYARSHESNLASGKGFKPSQEAASQSSNYFKQARSSFDRQQWQEAIDLCQKALELDPQSAEVYSLLGNSWYAQRDLEEAKEAYLKAITLNPKLLSAQGNLGSVYAELEESEAAIACYREALKLDPKQPLVHSNWGQLHLQLQQGEEAAACYRRAMELDPNSAKAYRGLGEALSQQEEWEQAIDAYRHALELDPTLVGVQSQLAEALKQQSQVYASAALESYRLAIEETPNELDLYHQALDIQPDDARLYAQLGTALVRRNELDEAIVFFRMGLEVESGNAKGASQLYLEFGNAWAKRGKFLDAIRFYREGIELDPENNLLAWQIQNTQAMQDREFAYPVNMVEHIRLTEPQPLTLNTSDRPIVSIIIPVYNQILHTYNCLRSLAATLDGSLPFEVIVMDDHSSDNTQEVLAQIQGVRSVFNEQNLGFIGSCNRGASLAKGEYLFFLNNDTVVMPNCIQELLETFKIVPKAGLVGAKLIYPNGKLQEAGGIIWQDGSAWNYGRLDHPNKPEYCYLREVDYCSGAAILIPTSLWTQIGGFDPRYKPAYAEDSDLAFEVRKAGYKVLYQPLAQVVHFEGISSGTDITKGVKRYQVINHQKLIEKWKNTLQYHRPNGVEPHLERERPVQKRALFIDACTLTPDQDAGSLKIFNYIKIFQEFSYKITFIPSNLVHSGHYTSDLQRIGVECLYWTYIDSVKPHLEQYGHQYDLVFLSRPYVAIECLDDVKKYCPNVPILYDTADLHYVREQRQAEIENNPELYEKAKQTKEQELYIVENVDCTITVSQKEKDILLTENPNAKIEVISTAHEIYGSAMEFEKRKNILFIGGFQHTPNIDAVIYFCQDVFPLIQKEIPDIKFFVIGSKPTEEIKQLQSDTIIISGYIPDISSYFNECRLSVVPLRYGAGIKGKIVTSFSYGLPVVSTSVGSEGMNLVNNSDVLVSDRTEEFAKSVVRLYSNKELWTQLSRRGIEIVERDYSIQASKRKFKNLIEELIGES